jgi:MOSC domain-containing protein YiiM
MAIVIEDGEIRPGDPIQLHLPPGSPAPLDVV